MKTRKRFLVAVLIVIVLLHLTPVTASAGDKSFSTLVKRIQSSYKGKRQGFFGMVTFGRFLVKMIRPAGVKNFKVVVLKELNFSENASDAEFGRSVRSAVDPRWRQLFHYTSRPEHQWSHTYIQESGKHVKILVAMIQKREAYVVQFKFDPDKLAKFIDDPKILGISLKGDGNNKNSVDLDKDADDDAKKSDDPEKKDNPTRNE